MQGYFEQDHKSGNTGTGYWSVMSGICFWGGLYTWGGGKRTHEKKIKQNNPQPKPKAILHTEEGTSQ